MINKLKEFLCKVSVIYETAKKVKKTEEYNIGMMLLAYACLIALLWFVGVNLMMNGLV